MAKQNKRKAEKQTPLPAPQSGHNTSAPSSELVERFLDLQQQELKLRTEELALHAQQEANNKSIAEASISANLQDRESERSHRERKTKLFFVGSTVIIVILTLFAGFALYTGKEDIVMKMVEIMAIFTAGFVGGYGFKSSRSKPDQNIHG